MVVCDWLISIRNTDHYTAVETSGNSQNFFAGSEVFFVLVQQFLSFLHYSLYFVSLCDESFRSVVL